MRNTVESLENKYKFKLEDILPLYEDLTPLHKMVEVSGISEMRLRNILAVLNLRLKKKHRANDLLILKQRLSEDKDGFIASKLKECNNNLEFIQKEYFKASKTIQRLRDKSNLLNKHIRELNRNENTIEAIVDKLKGDLDSLEPFPITIRTIEPTLEGTTVLILSDIHFGERIDGTSNNNFNVFNDDICTHKLIKLAQEVQTVSWRTNKLAIFLVGDLINGVIHNADLKSEEPVLKGVVKFATVLSNLFNSLEITFQEGVSVYMVNGNHSRLSDNQKSYQKAFDLEYLLYSLLKEQLNFTINIEYSYTGYMAVDIEEHSVGLMHGDMIRSYNGDYNNTLKVKNIIDNICRSNIQSIVSGHTHQAKVVQNQIGGFNIVNGCLNGMNEYGLSNGFDIVRPSQTIGRIANGKWEDIKIVEV